MRALLTLVALAAAGAETFLDEKQASALVLRGCQEIRRETQTLPEPVRRQLEARAGSRFEAHSYDILVALQAGAPEAYAVVMNEMGKTDPITFMVGIDKQGRVLDVAVMVYREAHGGEVREKRFLRQFQGKRLSNPVRVNQDIMNYTGATLSSEAIARGVKKALALVDCLYLHR